MSFKCIPLIAGLSASLVAGRTQDKRGCTELPYLPRYPGTVIADCQHKEYKELEIEVGEKEKKTVAGDYHQLDYSWPEGLTGDQVAANYRASLASGGFDVVYSSPRVVVAKASKEGVETWVRVSAYGATAVKAVRVKGIEQKMGAADATKLLGDLQAVGKVAIYGIHFDTGKAEIKPESKPTLDEIAKLLTENAHLRVYVVGHTDNVGGLEGNLDLSKRRAESVVKALAATYGVAEARLRSHGVGPLAPVASNQSEGGRARNRRVELVMQ
ncbi:MAG: OmpA family protein [Myxococcales bacterium]|nr:OmpA family protein [Myxococcales bacterium]